MLLGVRGSSFAKALLWGFNRGDSELSSTMSFFSAAITALFSSSVSSGMGISDTEGGHVSAVRSSEATTDFLVTRT
jgi:hypothetical protein